MISNIVVLLVIVLCFYLGVLYLNQTILLIGYALGVLSILSFIEILYRLFTVKCYVDIPISMVDQGKPVQVRIVIRNKSILPAGKVEIRIKNKNIFGKEYKAQWVSIGDVAKGETTHRVNLQLEGAGCHDIFVTHIRIHSFFGLFSWKRRCKEFSSVLILPEIRPMNVQVTEYVRNFLGDADVYDDFRPGHDSSESFEIRAYREKDKLQSIHWKLTAKMDELMVKENSFPKACAIVLMLEFRPWKKSFTRKSKVPSGTYLEVLASLSYALMDQKCPHFVAWYSKEKEGIRRIRVDDEESFYLFLSAFLREVVSCEKDIREEYRREYQSEWYLHDIVINEKMELYKNGEFFIKLEEKKIKDECERLELLL